MFIECPDEVGMYRDNRKLINSETLPAGRQDAKKAKAKERTIKMIKRKTPTPSWQAKNVKRRMNYLIVSESGEGRSQKAKVKSET